MISFDDFKKVEITVGKILSAEKVPETEKLLKLMVDFGISPLAKGVPPSSEGRVVSPLTRGALPSPAYAEASAGRSAGGVSTTPALADSATPFVKGETPPLARDIRQIISGVAAYFPDPRALVGKKCMFVTNIEPRVTKGLESNGMILAVSTVDGKFSLLEPQAEIPEGTKAK